MCDFKRAGLGEFAREAAPLPFGAAGLLGSLRDQMEQADRLGLDLVAIRIAEAIDQLVTDTSGAQTR